MATVRTFVESQLLWIVRVQPSRRSRKRYTPFTGSFASINVWPVDSAKATKSSGDPGSVARTSSVSPIAIASIALFVLRIGRGQARFRASKVLSGIDPRVRPRQKLLVLHESSISDPKVCVEVLHQCSACDVCLLLMRLLEPVALQPTKVIAIVPQISTRTKKIST